MTMITIEVSSDDDNDDENNMMLTQSLFYLFEKSTSIAGEMCHRCLIVITVNDHRSCFIS